MKIKKNMLLVSTIFASLMIAAGVAYAETATLPGSACVATGGSADKGTIGFQGEYIWNDTTQSKNVHCPVMLSNSLYGYRTLGRGEPPVQVFNVGNASDDTLTCAIQSLLGGRNGSGLQAGGYTASSKKVGYGAAKLQVTGVKPTQQTVSYISYCYLPAAIGTYRGAGSVIYNVQYNY